MSMHDVDGGDPWKAVERLRNQLWLHHANYTHAPGATCPVCGQVLPPLGPGDAP